MDKRFEATHKVMGRRDSLEKELRILNRIVRWCTHGIEIEADPRHVKTIIKELGLESARPVATPAVRDPGAKGSRCYNDDEDDEAEVDHPHAEGNSIMAVVLEAAQKDEGEDEIDPWGSYDIEEDMKAEASGEKLPPAAATAYRSLVT